MARNTGNGTRIGIIGGRTQCYNEHTDCYIKRDTQTGQFIGVKKSEPFKDIRRENIPEKSTSKK